MASKVPGRRERRRTATRERIFRAALALFAEQGVAATTVEQITEAADVGKGTFFNYFPSKEHVLAAFGEMQMRKLQAVHLDQGGFPTAMRRALQALAEVPGQSPTLVRSLVAAFLSGEAARQLTRGNLKRGMSYLAKVIEAAQERGELRSDVPAALLARFFMQNWFGTLVVWSLFPGEELTRRLNASFNLVADAIEPQGREVTG